METPSQTCVRLIGALEDLGAQEAACLGTRDFDALFQVQERADPLIKYLGEHRADAVAAGIENRIAAWLARREENARRLATEITAAKTRIDQLDANRRRLTRVAPAYGARDATSPRWQAVG